MIKIVIDTLASDNGIEEIVKGAILGASRYQDLQIVLSGPVDKIEAIIKENSSDKIFNYLIIDANDEITNNDNPIVASRAKTTSSLVQAVDYLKNNDDACALISTGSTGAILTLSIMELEKICNCRPVLTCMLPNDHGSMFCIADCGANPDCKSEHLYEFANVGCAFQEAMGIENPKIALLSNGSEDKKGNMLTKIVFGMLKNSNLNFVGNVEGTKILSADFDVLVCDGFSGNIVLKNIEGTAKTIIKDIVKMAKTTQDENEKLAYNKLIAYFMQKYDFNSLGASILLGTNKLVLKAHGSATKETIDNVITQAYTLLKNNIIEKINARLKNINLSGKSE